jgi:hypothetical protein
LRELGIESLQDLNDPERWPGGYEALRSEKVLQVFTSVQIRRLLTAASGDDLAKGVVVESANKEIPAAAVQSRFLGKEQEGMEGEVEGAPTMSAVKKLAVAVSENMTRPTSRICPTEPTLDTTSSPVPPTIDGADDAIDADAGFTLSISKKTLKWSLAAAFVTAVISSMAVALVMSLGEAGDEGNVRSENSNVRGRSVSSENSPYRTSVISSASTN